MLSRRTWPPSLRQRTLSILMLILAWAGYRRWLSRPWQWSLRDYMIVVAICSAGLALSGYPVIMIIFFTAITGAVFICLSLGRHGFKFTDIITLLAMILLAAAFVLPKIEQTRSRTLSKQFLRSFVPGEVHHLIFWLKMRSTRLYGPHAKARKAFMNGIILALHDEWITDSLPEDLNLDNAPLIIDIEH